MWYGGSVKLPPSEHLARPWRIHEIAPDFRLEDVWALDTPGGADDFPRLLRTFTSMDPGEGSKVVGALFALRWKLGALFGWDEAGEGLGKRVPTLRDRIPGEPPEGFASGLPFEPLYVTGDEAAAEIANSTMHGVLHLGWVPKGDGTYRGQLAVLVKPNGRLGAAYMAAIAPFRYALVYPHMLRRIAQAWRTPA